jgi:hypothetical protein
MVENPITVDRHPMGMMQTPAREKVMLRPWPEPLDEGHAEARPFPFMRDRSHASFFKCLAHLGQICPWLSLEMLKMLHHAAHLTTRGDGKRNRTAICAEVVLRHLDIPRDESSALLEDVRN